MTSLDEARALVLSEAAAIPRAGAGEDLSLDEALGRVLAGDLRAAGPLPPFDKAAMDGCALNSADAAGAGASAPARLALRGVLRAGEAAPVLERGTVLRIMTGAPLPSGADCVLESEEARIEDGFLVLEAAPKRGRHVLRRGEEIGAGELALPAGTRLGPPQLGFLAALGYASVPVFPRTRAVLLSTGDELAGPGAALGPGAVRDANGPLLAALLAEAGAELLYSRRVADDKAALAEAFGDALETADLVLSTGGVSGGDRDLVPAVLEELGCRTVFRGVALKPGKPLLFAVRRRTLVFALPGNPLGAYAGFRELASPALASLSGAVPAAEAWFEAEAADAFPGRAGRPRLVYARLANEGGRLLAYSAGPSSPSHLATLARSNGVLSVEAERGDIAPGEKVRARFI